MLIITGDYADDPGNTFVLGEKSPGFNCMFYDNRLCTLVMLTYGTVLGPVDCPPAECFSQVPVARAPVAPTLTGPGPFDDVTDCGLMLFMLSSICLTSFWVTFRAASVSLATIWDVTWALSLPL